MERKITKYFEILISLSIGIFLVYFFDYLNIFYFQLLNAIIIEKFLNFYFSEIIRSNEKIYINNIEFVISRDCLKISSFLLIFPFFLLRKKFKLIFLFLFLTYFQNFFRIIFEIFLILNFEINLDFFFYNFQNIFQPIILYLILILFYYNSSFKLSNKRIFRFF